jgi:hypothetical protein
LCRKLKYKELDLGQSRGGGDQANRLKNIIGEVGPAEGTKNEELKIHQTRGY